MTRKYNYDQFSSQSCQLCVEFSDEHNHGCFLGRITIHYVAGCLSDVSYCGFDLPVAQVSQEIYRAMNIFIRCLTANPSEIKSLLSTQTF